MTTHLEKTGQKTYASEERASSLAEFVFLTALLGGVAVYIIKSQAMGYFIQSSEDTLDAETSAHAAMGALASRGMSGERVNLDGTTANMTFSEANAEIAAARNFLAINGYQESTDPNKLCFSYMVAFRDPDCTSPGVNFNDIRSDPACLGRFRNPMCNTAAENILRGQELCVLRGYCLHDLDTQQITFIPGSRELPANPLASNINLAPPINTAPPEVTIPPAPPDDNSGGHGHGLNPYE